MNCRPHTAAPVGQITVITGSIAVTAAAVLGAIVLGAPASGPVAGEMSTGVTITETAPPVLHAVPSITGPAPLPKEEQGLPG